MKMETCDENERLFSRVINYKVIAIKAREGFIFGTKTGSRMYCSMASFLSHPLTNGGTTRSLCNIAIVV